MTERRPLPRAIQQGPISVARALELGVSPGRLNASDLQAPFRGVRMPASMVPEPLQRARALATILSNGQFFSHQTAALIWGMPLPWSLQNDGILHVSAFRPQHPPRRIGVVGHVIAPGTVITQEWLGLPVTAPASTWTELATVLTLYELVAVGDYLLRGVETSPPNAQRPVYTPLATGTGLKAAVDRTPRAGTAKLRKALERVREGVESPRETVLRLTLIEWGLPEPEINKEIYSDAGEFLGRVDLCYPGFKVIVEYDGEQHRENRYQFDRDIDRIAKLEENGWRVIRVRHALLQRNPGEVVRRVRVALSQRGWVPVAAN
ncbi:hypothetical protein L1277_002164 [Okibacterium sp. HSC-33S16]|uniref:endonuclease domain-containing protein n=1 Tax=Okibacterium sp. HSC-33S16 TaxID=2910965 RepID=UPI0020A21E0B|nr:DUF559 domain-containing protein [Okibacterium sp. HSC-33S16]MCP2032065.1 hypothetical protein [Okibacterium sp. HSC-33S16]